MFTDMSIRRKHLPHETPLGIVSEDALFFVTFGLRERGSDAITRNAGPILEAVARRHADGIWYCRIFLLMPDHVHALLWFPDPSQPMRKAISDFKRWTARAGGFEWQRDFFDHRLRKEESVHEKADYILMNPVRAGLVNTPESWPHVFIARDALG